MWGAAERTPARQQTTREAVNVDNRTFLQAQEGLRSALVYYHYTNIQQHKYSAFVVVCMGKGAIELQKTNEERDYVYDLSSCQRGCLLNVAALTVLVLLLLLL
jgi:hypothetical protein